MGVCAIVLGLVFAMTANQCAAGQTSSNKTTDLTKITWAHAVNSKAFLDKVLKDSSIDMIEADVILGTINGSASIIPVMAHPPNDSSDLSLESFLTTVTQSNKINLKKKGIKLDFKSIAAFENASKYVLSRFNTSITYPLWLNADILKGPSTDGTTRDPVNADDFLSGAKNHSKAVLSLGWTTNVTSSKILNYTETQINEMLSLLKKHNVTQEVTFAVRACIAAESIPQMLNLTRGWSNSTLTIWLSNPNDTVNIPKLEKLITEVERSHIYLDVPENMKKKLLGSASVLSYSVFMVLLTALLLWFNRP